MAHETEHVGSEVKVHFTIREGMYEQTATSDFFFQKRVPYASPSTPSGTALVKTSFVKVKQNESDKDKEDCICFTVGKCLFYFTYASFSQSKQPNFVDKRIYKGSAPSCHDINQFTASLESVKVAVGFRAGQVQIIDVHKKESLQIMNEVRSIDKSSVTCVKWYPNNENLILSGHICGFMYTYDITQPCSEVPPVYYTQPYKVKDGYSIYSVKSKSSSNPSNSYNSSSSYLNPMYKWVMSTDGTAVCSFEFSPCTRFVAVVTQSGYLRVIDHQSFESYGCMKSYFGGLMTCSWSPDGRFIATGGEDDLITVWSFCQQCVIARGSSHKSWVSDIAFDPYQCAIPSDAEMKAFYNLSTVDEFVAAHSAFLSSSSNEKLSEPTFEKESLMSSNLLKFKTVDSKENINNSKTNRCNGDSKRSVSSDTIKRLRTYSNVSHLSRLSIGIERPPLCYRFGSVGQDSQLCLWEIDENTFDFLRRRPSLIMKRREQTSKSVKNAAEPVRDSGINTCGSNSDLPMIAGSSGSEVSSGGSNTFQYYLHNQAPASNPSIELGASSHSSSIPHSINSSTTQSKKDNSRSSKSSSNSSNGFSVIRKFSTIGSHDRSRKETKQQQQHKRNLSLPYFGNKSTSSHNGTSKAVSNQNNKKQTNQIFGTILCPCLEDTAMLDPLTCKKITQSRLTSISFKQECILISSQDGFMQAWKRPNGDAEVSHLPIQPISNNVIKQNGTVV